MSDLYSNFVFCQATASIASGDTTITVDDVSSFPSNSALAASNLWMVIESPLTHPSSFEIVQVSSVNTSTKVLTVVRGQEGTTAQSHASGAYLKGSLTAGMLTRLAASLPSYPMNYRGAWSNQSYAVNDVVTYNNKLYVCTTPVSAGASPSFVNSIGYTSQPAAAANLTLPSGCAAGDILLFQLNVFATPVTPISGASLVYTSTSLGSGMWDNLYAYTLTSTDITHGYVSCAAQNAIYSTLMFVFRGVGAPTTSSSSAKNTMTVPTFTPSASGYAILIASMGGISGGPPSTATASGVSGILQTFNSNAGVYSWGGYKAITSGTPVAATTFTPNNGTSGNSTYEDAYSVSVVSTSTFPTGSFTEVATDAVNGMSYKGAWSGSSAYNLNDVVTSGSKLYVCTTAYTGANGATYIGSTVLPNVGVSTIALPTGSLSGDTVFLGIYCGVNTQTTPTGMTLLGGFATSGTARMDVYYKVLTSTDITNGTLTLPTTGEFNSVNNSPVVLYGVRNVGTPTLKSSGTGGLTTTSYTPAASGMTIMFGGSLTSSTSDGSITMTGSPLANIVAENNGTNEFAIGIGNEITTAGTAVTSVTMAYALDRGGAGSAYKGWIVADMAGTSGTSPSPSYFTEIAVDLAVITGGANTYTGANTFSAIQTFSAGSVQQLLFATVATRSGAVTLGVSSAGWNLCNATSAAFTLTLPSTSSGACFLLMKSDVSANAVTVNVSGGGTINGQSSYVLSNQYDYIYVMNTGSVGVYDIVAQRLPQTKRTVFLASGTYTKASNPVPQLVRVTMVSPGGGGAGGYRGVSGSAIPGGGGGGGGAMTWGDLQASDLPATVAVVVGAGGTAGAAASVDSSAGGAGGSGSASCQFGAASDYFMTTSNATGGGAPTSTVGGAAGAGGNGLISGAAGGAGSSGVAAGSNGVIANACGGGGGGGGVTTGVVFTAGGAGFGSWVWNAGVAGGATDGASGTAPWGRTTNKHTPMPGNAGPGGAGSASTTGGSGAAGGFPGGGGGGGGGSVNGHASGAGGAGGSGILVVDEYF